jgi:microsomal dipeptidase-like Zn-dependent dipeptidase
VCATGYRPDGARDAETSMLEQVGEDGLGLVSDFDDPKMPSRVGYPAKVQNLVGALTARRFDQAPM